MVKVEYEIIHTQFFAEIDSDGNYLIDEFIQSKPLEIRFVLPFSFFFFVTNLQNRTGSDLFSPDKIGSGSFGGPL